MNDEREKKQAKQSKTRIFSTDTNYTKQSHEATIFMEPFQMNHDYNHTWMSLDAEAVAEILRRQSHEIPVGFPPWVPLYDFEPIL